ncbi:hypothetical protein BaRGS_00012459, partial [Batillaria attramentaria]
MEGEQNNSMKLVAFTALPDPHGDSTICTGGDKVFTIQSVSDYERMHEGQLEEAVGKHETQETERMYTERSVHGLMSGRQVLTRKLDGEAAACYSNPPGCVVYLIRYYGNFSCSLGKSRGVVVELSAYLEAQALISVHIRRFPLTEVSASTVPTPAGRRGLLSLDLNASEMQLQHRREPACGRVG